MTLETGLIGHWPFQQDVGDRSPSALDVQNIGVRVVPAAPGGPYPSAAQFDGIESHLVVPDHPALHLGTQGFSLALWIHTPDRNGDVIGDILSKFDPAERRGFGLSVVTNGGMTTTTQANYRNLHFGVDCGLTDETWADHGRPGNATKITALHVSDDRLYAGTFEMGAQQTGHLWLFDGGNQWLDLGGSPDGSNAIPSIARLNGALYCSTGRYYPFGSALGPVQNPSPGGRVYRVEGDGRWIDCGHPGTEDATPEEVVTEGYETGKADDAMSLTVFDGELYVTSNHRRGAFKYEGGQRWEYIGPDERILTFTAYRGALYALINGGPVYRYEGDGEWEHCGGPAGSTQTYSAAIYRGDLHVGTWPEGEVFRYAGGQAWSKVSRVGYEREIMAMALYNQKLYVGALPMANVYRMDGDAFSLVGNLDSTPTAYLRRVWSMAVYGGRLYGGTLPSGHVLSLQAGAMATCDRALPPGWHHVAAVRTGDRLKLYLDGEPVARSALIRAVDYDLTQEQPLLIGSGAHSSYHGAMSDLRLYDRPLTPAEVGALAKR
jgi:hypothetical protein